MIEVYDFNEYEQARWKIGSYGGNSGRKDAIILDGDVWMIKYPKISRSMVDADVSYTTAPLSEFIGSHIYGILGLDVHETKLGFLNDKIVVACRDFVKNDEVLREFRQIKNYANKTLSEKLDFEVESSVDDHRVNLEEILLHLKYNEILCDISGINERFWDMVIVDILINNNDRNNGNWGLIFKDNKYTLAPIYDNGASFSNKKNNEQIRDLLDSEAILLSSSVNIFTAYNYQGEKLTAKKILDFDNSYLFDSLSRLIPLIEEKFIEIKDFISQIPETYKGLEVCSPERKEYYIKSMELRFGELLKPKMELIQAAKRESKDVDKRREDEKIPLDK